jgi:hypothetical protein
MVTGSTGTMLCPRTREHQSSLCFSLVHLLERPIEETEGREWAMMAVVNNGTLLECGRPQGSLWLLIATQSSST